MMKRETRDVQNEKRIIGSVLLTPTLMNQVVEYGVSADDFTSQQTIILFQGLQAMYANGGIDHQKLAMKLLADGTMQQAGGTNEVLDITKELPVRSDIGPFLKQLIEYSKLRKLQELTQKCAKYTENPDYSAEGIGSYLKEQADKIAGRGTTDAGIHISTIFDFVIKQQSELAKRAKGETLGLRSGLNCLDKFTSGLFLGEYTVWGGHTSDGKSSIAIQAALANATQGVPVHVFSVEMSREMMTLRMLPLITGVPFKRLRDWRELQEGDEFRIRSAKRTIDTLPVFVDDIAGVEISELCNRVRRMAQQKGTQLVIVDYLQLVRAKDAKSRLDRVNMVSEGLRELAKEQNVHVMALSQLARGEGRKKDRPTLFHLKESSQLEQDAYVVVFVYRPLDAEGNYTWEDELIIAKNRSGPIKTLPVVYNTELLCYQERNNGKD